MNREQINCLMDSFKKFKEKLGQGNSNKDIQLQNLVEFVVMRVLMLIKEKAISGISFLPMQDNIKRQTDVLLRSDGKPDPY